MSKTLNSVDIYEIYSKSKSISQIKRSLLVKEDTNQSGGIKLPNTPKAAPVVYFDKEDFNTPPTTFEVDIDTTIVFNLESIAEDFTMNVRRGEEPEEPAEDVPDDANAADDRFAAMIPKNIPDADIEEPNSDDKIDAMIQQSKQQSGAPVKRKAIELNRPEIYSAVFKKRLSDYAVMNKLRDFVRAGVITQSEFNVADVTHSTKVDAKLLEKQFYLQYSHRPKGPIKSQFGYAITLVAKNDKRQYSKQECIAAAKTFVAQFEKTILAKQKYFDFVV